MPMWARAGAVRLSRRLRREPLAQFLAIGLALFVADRALGERASQEGRIVVGDAVQRTIVARHVAVHDRPPTADELAALSRRWAEREALFREARALGLAEGDPQIRQQLIDRARDLLLHAITLEVPDEATLRAWFERTKHRYGSPPVLSFSVAQSDGSEAAARRLAAALNDPDSEAPLPEIYPFIRYERTRLEAQFPPDLLSAIEALETGRWQAIDAPDGWHPVRLDERLPGENPPFESVREDVALDWLDAEEARRARVARDRLMRDYDVEIEPVAIETLVEARRAASGGR
ncbi:MAG: peptidyl-prolyl cis-trans isomerase [Paracoccaceae bacterium]